ncbi:MAG: hypothetical protein NT079_01030 [Candidatus Omnitrophica bacterium]|nr:hypothetical protein [Candidatus Omnitrophota bacterium]
MKTKRFIFVLIFWVLGVSGASAQTLCVFKGTLDSARRKIQLEADFQDTGKIFFESTAKDSKVIDFKIYSQNLKLLFFNITTGIVGTAKIIARPDSDPIIQGVMFPSQGISSQEVSSRRIRGNFEIENDKIFLKQCGWEGLTGQGYFSFIPPYDTDLTVSLNNVLLSDLFAWLGQEKIYTQGDIEGQIHFSGFLNRLAIKGKLSSSGQIGDFRYDNIASSFEGIYPTVKLLETMTLPLIRQTNVDREWTIRRQKDGRKEGETEFKYRLKKERDVSGVEEAGTLTIQRSIKF